MNASPIESVKNVVLRMKELVRGQEQGFLDELAPVVVRESVALDFGSVERIDAAGLAALITLYTDACKAGHTLTVLQPSRHVREILQLVGLDRILIARSEAALRLWEHADAGNRRLSHAAIPRQPASVCQASIISRYSIPLRRTPAVPSASPVTPSTGKSIPQTIFLLTTQECRKAQCHIQSPGTHNLSGTSSWRAGPLFLYPFIWTAKRNHKMEALSHGAGRNGAGVC